MQSGCSPVILSIARGRHSVPLSRKLSLSRLNTIKHILARYTAFLWILLKPLGAWGVFVIGAIDAALLGLPVDVAVATYVYQNPHKLFLYVLMGSAGETLGSMLIYVIGYKGGEELLRKRISPARFEKIHATFDKHPFWSLMLPAILPPPTPFKLFALAAAVSEMQFGHYLLAIFAGRFVRFTLLAVLTLKFGPGFVHVIGPLFRKHLYAIGAVAVVGLIAWLLRRRRRMSSEESTTPELQKTPESPSPTMRPR
jgi:membrane protein YqaA with SNARE-associated domain